MRIRKVEDDKELEKAVDKYITNDYKVKSRDEGTVKVKKKDSGGIGTHLLIFLFLGLYTLLIPNLLYVLYRYSKSDEVLIKVEGD